MTEDELKKARSAYGMQVYNIRNKLDRLGNKVEMRLTFEEWLDIWVKSGHWLERGKKRGQYVMARKDDIGHYEIGNVSIVLHSENVAACLRWRNKNTTGKKASQSRLDALAKTITAKREAGLLKHSDETIAKMSEAKKKSWAERKARGPVIISLEARANMAKAQQIRWAKRRAEGWD